MQVKVYPTRRVILICVIIGLSLLATFYLIKGFAFLLFDDRGGGDMRQRWVEVQYVLSEQNPYDVWYTTPSGQAFRMSPWLVRSPTVDPFIGPPLVVAYPPWSFLLNIPFYWPSSAILRWYFAAFNLIALVVIGFVAARTTDVNDKPSKYLLVSSSLAIADNCSTLVVGQVGLIVTACMLLAMIFLRSSQQRRAGIALVLAMTKPTFSVPICWSLLVKGYWLLLAGIISTVAACSLLVGWWVDVNPIEMTLQWLVSSRNLQFFTTELAWLFSQIGVRPSAVPFIIIAMLLLCGIVSYRWRYADWPIQFAIAAIFARMGLFHRHYDNVIMVMLLLPVGQLALRSNRPMHWWIFGLLGVSLWIPARLCDRLGWRLYQMMIWPTALAVLLAANSSSQRNAAHSKSLPHLRTA